MKKMFMCFGLLLSLYYAGECLALPVVCEYTLEGSVGDYLLDFTITNNIPAEYNQKISAIRLEIPSATIAGAPAGSPSGFWYTLSIDDWRIWAGVSRYDLNTGIITPVTYILSGESLSGFEIRTSQIPDTIPFEIFANDLLYSQYGQDYYEGPGYFEDDAFLKGHYSGFRGTANAAAAPVPEPSSLALLGLGLSGLLLRKGKQFKWKK